MSIAILMEPNMTWLDRIDPLLLKLTDAIVRKINWLTGKDNFSVARAINTYGSIILTIDCGVGFFSMPSSLIFSLIWKLIFLWYGWLTISDYKKEKQHIKTVERIRAKEQYDQMKFIDLEVLLEMIRKMNLKILIFYTILAGMIMFLSEKPNTTSICTAIWMIGYGLKDIFIAYLLSIEKPPYAKSMLRELFRPMVILGRFQHNTT